MNKNGFTMIELLVIVVVLALISLIATPIVMTTLNKAKQSAYNSTCDSVERAARLYMTNELDNRIKVGETIEIDTNRLKKYLSDTHLVQWDYVVKVTRTSDGTEYYYTGREVPITEVYEKSKILDD